MAKAAKREATEGAERKEVRQSAVDRRVLRTQYLAVKSLICDERDDLSRVDSEKFRSIITEVESLHQLVQKPREQVADAEALLDIANTLVTSVRSIANEGVTPSDFVTALLRNYGRRNEMTNAGNDANTVYWANVGFAVSRIFKKVPGCCTMIGPMNTEVKLRRAVVRRQRTKLTRSSRPKELVGIEAALKSDTDKTMSTMFEVLRKMKCVRLEALVLNRHSFAQTVENVFALSFLVRDGRAEISVNDSGLHLVSPRNAPAASTVVSGEVSYHHFVFRFDYKDWKLMADAIDAGEELMPQRCSFKPTINNSQAAEPMQWDCKSPSTLIQELSQNGGFTVPQSVGNASVKEEHCDDGRNPFPKSVKKLCF